MCVRLLVLEGDYPGKLFAFQELKRRAAAGGNMCNPVRQGELIHCRNRVSTAHDRGTFAVRDGFRDLESPLAELWKLEHADRPIPEHRLCLENTLSEKRCGF